MAKGQEEVQNGGEDIIIYRQRDKIKGNGAKTEQSVGHLPCTWGGGHNS